MNVFLSGLSCVETTLAVRGFPVTYYPVDYPFFGINTSVAGSGYRVACGLTALGDDVDFLTVIGDDEQGRQIRSALASFGISDRYVYTYLKDTVQSVVLQETPFGRRQVYSDLKDVQDKTVDASLVSGAIDRADICAFLNVNFSRPLLRLARQKGKKIVADVQALTEVNDTFNAEFIDSADILFLNGEGTSKSSDEFFKALIVRCPAETIVMSLAEDGLVCYERAADRTTKLGAVSVGDVITAGAGAALFAGFLHYYGKYDCIEALKRAEVFAALKLAANPKGDFPTEEMVEKKLATVSF